MKPFLLFIFFLSVANTLRAQQKEFLFKNFTQEDGLPSNETYCVFEDSKHYLWIGTDHGAVRFNGNRFEQFDLPDNVVFLIKEDEDGRIWFFTQKCELAYFENEKVHPYKYNQLLQARINSIVIRDALIDKNGIIYLSSTLDTNYTIFPNGKIIAYSNQNLTAESETLFNINVSVDAKTYIEKKSKHVLSNKSLDIQVNHPKLKLKYHVTCQPMHLTYFGANASVSGETIFYCGRMIIKLLPNGEFFSTEMPDPVLCVKEIGNKIWAGLKNSGLYILNNRLEKDSSFENLPGLSVSSILEDFEEGVWITTLEKGLHYIKNRHITHILFDEVVNKNISGILSYKDSVLLFANSSGLYSLGEDVLKLIQYYPTYTVSHLLQDDHGNLYYAGGTYKIQDVVRQRTRFYKKLLVINSPGEIILAGKDTIIGPSPFGVVNYKNAVNRHPNLKGNFIEPAKIILNKPARIFMDAQYNLWAGTNDGLYKSLKPYDTMHAVCTACPNLKSGISAIRQFDNGVIAAAVRSNGIAIIRNDTVISLITEKDNLLSNKIKYLLPIQNKLWVATAKGLSILSFYSFEPVKFKVKNIDKHDGFTNLNINQLLTFKNHIVAATSNGIYFIERQEGSPTESQTPIPFYIRYLSSINRDTSISNNISVPYSKSNIKVAYTAISFNSFEKIRYLYRLGQEDTVWQTTTARERIFERLEPGSYKFQIRAVLPDEDRYSAIQQINIIIEKPWWQNNWLRLIAICFLAVLVYWIVSKRVKKIREAEQRKTALNAKLAELEQIALRSQMNPHFIFNCLTSIQQLIISGNKIAANEYLVKFARLIRKTLEMSARPFISIREEKNYLEEYLLLEQLRLSGRFNYSITADPSIDMAKTFIPNMMLQPVVENCVRHGIKSLENRPGNITVYFSLKPDYIICTITDNGVGRAKASGQGDGSFIKHKSYGIEILKKRLETFSQVNVDHSGIEVKDLYDDAQNPLGTQVKLKLPYQIRAVVTE